MESHKTHVLTCTCVRTLPIRTQAELPALCTTEKRRDGMPRASPPPQLVGALRCRPTCLSRSWRKGLAVHDLCRAGTARVLPRRPTSGATVDQLPPSSRRGACTTRAPPWPTATWSSRPVRRTTGRWWRTRATTSLPCSRCARAGREPSTLPL